MTDALFEAEVAAAAFIEPEVSPPDEEPVPLEALLEAIAAERRATQESANDAHPEPAYPQSMIAADPESAMEAEAMAGPALGTEALEPVKKKKAPATPRRPRATRPRSDTPASRKR
jgi:hypothetical protein